ncbi:MAG: DUF2490 domain-containing protein [Bacteroidetes bacterium]|nr:DUF2490 domain-containing protein [Bacteroidota bacterium]HET6243799.1 DUF2490 domain-containing protein [Bacteroidia bacterium]
MNKHLNKLTHALCLFLFLINVSAFSQSSSNKTGNWTMFFGQLRLHDKWSIHTEAQYRDYGIFDEAEQILLRSGINFHLQSSSSLSAGYARVNSYTDNDELMESPHSSENRIWQQFLMRNNLGRFIFEHRYRLEQRWKQTNDNIQYLNRIRYLLRITVPLNKQKIEKNTLFLSLYDEVFIHFSSPPFDRNRLYGAIGYQFIPNANIQIGYLAQTVNTTTKHYLQAAIFYNIDFRKKE